MIRTPFSHNFLGGIRLIRVYAHLFRLPPAIMAAMAGCAAIYALNSAAQIHQYLLTAVILVCMNSAACAINDYWDLDKDRIDHPERPLPSGRLKPQQAWRAAVILFTAALIAAIPLGVYPFILVAVNTLLLWNYSHLLLYNGIFGNLIVSAVVASILFLSGLVAGSPFAMAYPTGLVFFYIWAKEIIWDVHDKKGDRAQGIVTIPNHWGDSTAFWIVWGLIIALMASIPVAFLLLPMKHPILFAVFCSLMLLTLGAATARFQRSRSASAYEGFIFWERLSVLFGVIGLLGTAPPL
ncbi:MAG: geranylgeranylglycerol-phosphate geranylgeranyltransferase [Leptolyngbyaceae cyanobacterium MO_188.B28]|nr:geranylgeranylglycerol-phosphate geranylgeranyltransferase [Leptolyngbyaceae cyanobacterium MO_188.B28]